MKKAAPEPKSYQVTEEDMAEFEREMLFKALSAEEEDALDNKP